MVGVMVVVEVEFSLVVLVVVMMREWQQLLQVSTLLVTVILVDTK